MRSPYRPSDRTSHRRGPCRSRRFPARDALPLLCPAIAAGVTGPRRVDASRLVSGAVDGAAPAVIARSATRSAVPPFGSHGSPFAGLRTPMRPAPPRSVLALRRDGSAHVPRAAGSLRPFRHVAGPPRRGGGVSAPRTAPPGETLPSSPVPLRRARGRPARIRAWLRLGGVCAGAVRRGGRAAFRAWLRLGAARPGALPARFWAWLRLGARRFWGIVCLVGIIQRGRGSLRRRHGAVAPRLPGSGCLSYRAARLTLGGVVALVCSAQGSRGPAGRIMASAWGLPLCVRPHFGPCGAFSRPLGFCAGASRGVVLLCGGCRTSRPWGRLAASLRVASFPRFASRSTMPPPS